MTNALGASVGVFCGARSGARPEYIEMAREFGLALAKRNNSLIYGGGCGGIMGSVAHAAWEAGAEVTGVVPCFLLGREQTDVNFGRMMIVGSIHQRKALMYRLSSGFALLPGGVETLDEFFEIMAWRKLGIQEKPIAVLNSHGFFDPVLALLDHVVAEGFLDGDVRAAVQVAYEPEDALEMLDGTRAPNPDGANSDSGVIHSTAENPDRLASLARGQINHCTWLGCKMNDPSGMESYETHRLNPMSHTCEDAR